MTARTPDSHPSVDYDVAIVGGGPAGLAAALALGRALRRVLVLDTGSPRNRFASHMHTVLGNEGLPPSALAAKGREEAARYGVEFRDLGVTSVTEPDDRDPREPRRLTVTLSDGSEVGARAVIAASGITDELPDLPGLAERWGRTVLHCPYCHGWEFRGSRIGVIAFHPMALHHAELLRQWTDDLTFFSAGAGELAPETRQRLEGRNVRIETAEVTELGGDPDEAMTVGLADGRTTELDAAFVIGRAVPHDAYLAGLDLERTETPVGSVIAADALSGQTSHDRVWAVGNIASPMANVPMSISAGTMAGATANMTLVTEDFDLGAP